MVNNSTNIKINKTNNNLSPKESLTNINKTNNNLSPKESLNSQQFHQYQQNKQ